jgi:CcmD family protein
MGYLVAAYAAVFLVLGGYGVRLRNRRRRLAAHLAATRSETASSALGSARIEGDPPSPP